MPTAVDTTALLEALTGLAGGWPRPRPARLSRAIWGRPGGAGWPGYLDDYLLPRVRDLEAPLVCILPLSTGAGSRRCSTAWPARP